MEQTGRLSRKERRVAAQKRRDTLYTHLSGELSLDLLSSHDMKSSFKRLHDNVIAELKMHPNDKTLINQVYIEVLKTAVDAAEFAKNATIEKMRKEGSLKTCPEKG